MTTLATKKLEVQATKHLFGDEIILFDLNGSPRFGTRAVKPGSTYVFTTTAFPINEPLTIIGNHPFKNATIETNTPLQIIDTIPPGKDTFEFIVDFRLVQQTVSIELDVSGVEAGELQFNDDRSKLFPWRAVLRLKGTHATARLIKELPPSSPLNYYTFEVFNQANGARVPTVPNNGFRTVTANAGFYSVFAVKANTAERPDPLQVGGTDAADLIITPL